MAFAQETDFPIEERTIKFNLPSIQTTNLLTEPQTVAFFALNDPDRNCISPEIALTGVQIEDTP